MNLISKSRLLLPPAERLQLLLCGLFLTTDRWPPKHILCTPEPWHVDTTKHRKEAFRSQQSTTIYNNLQPEMPQNPIESDRISPL